MIYPKMCPRYVKIHGHMEGYVQGYTKDISKDVSNDIMGWLMGGLGNGDPGGPSGLLGIYFSAHWCPHCSNDQIGFTPKLKTWYDDLKKAGLEQGRDQISECRHTDTTA